MILKMSIQHPGAEMPEVSQPGVWKNASIPEPGTGVIEGRDSLEQERKRKLDWPQMWL